MPIYMDRHNVSESVTAEHVAQLHQEDLKIQDQFGCRGLTYWFDDKRKTAFCLIEAPNKEALEAMHNQAHGEIPHSIIEVDSGIVESFLGRIEDPKKTAANTLHIIDDPAFRTIMVITIASSLSKQHDFYSLTSLYKEYYEAVHLLLAKNEGRIVKETDDHILVSFESVSRAVTAAMDIKAKTHEQPYENIGVKIGLSAGVPVTQKKSIFEDTINLAERICDMIPAEVILSVDVANLTDNEKLNALLEEGNMVILKPDEEIFITQLMDFIDASWSDANLKVDDLTKPAGVSKSQLYRKLKILSGKSPNTFLKDYRLKKALDLLNKHTSNVSEIAFETGFTSPSYFSKCFQKKYGHSPSVHLATHA